MCRSGLWMNRPVSGCRRATEPWSRGQGAQWLWLEVRASNVRAQQIYERQGYRRVGQRKGYYPADQGRREDAVVMSLRL